jgi:hypothetical protein
MKLSRRLQLVALLVFALSSRPLDAGDKKDKPPSEPPGSGPEHKRLHELVGTFDAVITAHLDAGKTAEFKGVVKRQMILDGRFLQEEYEGTFAGKPLKGLLFLGYDTAKKKYVSTNMDNTNNAILSSEGPYDEKTKTFTMAGAVVDFVSGKLVSTRDVLRIVGPDEQAMEIYHQLPEGKEFKAMSGRFTRRK